MTESTDIFNDGNYPPGAKNRSDAPYNDDSIPCPECKDGKDEFNDDCWWCGGEGVISERKYKEQVKIMQEEFKANE